MILSRGLKKQSIKMERMFVQNLRSRDIEQQVLGLKKPLYEGHLLDRDIHISEIEIPENSTWSGLCLADLRLSNRFGIHVSSILRGHRRINIPGGDDIDSPATSCRSSAATRSWLLRTLPSPSTSNPTTRT